jgi:hypothetical protein
MKHLYKYIGIILGLFILIWCVIFFVLGFIFKTIVDILSWFEVRCGRLMKKFMSAEL